MARFSIPSMGSKQNSSKRGSIGDFARKNPDLMKMDPSKRNEAIMNFTLEAKQAELGTRKAGNNFKLPGAASQEKELSKTAKEMLEKMIQKQIKKRQKEVVAIRACWFGNGRIAKDGKIYDASNKCVGKIDPETMKITMGMFSMGKYTDSPMTLTKLARKIDSMKAPAPTGGGGMGNFYGTADTGSQTNWW